MTLDGPALATVLMRVTHRLEEEKDKLTDLDAAVGDGDLGISVARGARGVREAIDADPEDIGQLLITAGTSFADTAGATIGALLGLGLVGAGRLAVGKTWIELSDMAAMLRAAEETIQHRGKAGLGDKTLLDVLIPVREVLDEAVRDGLTRGETASSVLEAAEQGMIATVHMKGRFGRGRWLSERAIGVQDPGARAMYVMVRAAVESYSGTSRECDRLGWPH